MYWAAATTNDGPKELVVAKWKSLINHVLNIHHGHGELFPDCAHGQLEGADARKQWLKPGTHKLA